jgi:5-methylcytosine-specific restriction enzyme subunit McrC
MTRLMNSKNLSNYILPFSEHCGFRDDFQLEEEYANLLSDNYYEQWFAKTHRGGSADMRCFYIQKDLEGNNYKLETGYFIGVDWVIEQEVAIYIEPKLNMKQNEKDKGTLYEVDYLRMLFTALKDAVSEKEIKALFHIKWNKPAIEIPQKHDLLTPLLIVQYLSVLKQIVKKGLKKSYYKVQRNLKSRIKGKVLVSQNIKQNQANAKYLNTFCSYDEFGIDHKENRILKKALSFIKRYLPQTLGKEAFTGLQDSFNFVNPAFAKVSDQIELKEIKQTKVNAFYKEYTEAVRLARLILKRFGYNISSISKSEVVKTPPFWIDMSKLFELYVLKKLRTSFGKKVKYHFTTYGNELDYLLNLDSVKMVIDAKYKPQWKKDNPIHKDVRQLSGYARLRVVQEELGYSKDQAKLLDCLVIYPDPTIQTKEIELDDLRMTDVKAYDNFYKLGIQLPTI